MKTQNYLSGTASELDRVGIDTVADISGVLNNLPSEEEFDELREKIDALRRDDNGRIDGRLRHRIPE